MKRFGTWLVSLVFCAAVVSAQTTKEQRKQIEKDLESAFQMSKMALFDSTTVDKPGAVYVVHADGIQGEVLLQSGTAFTYVIDGKIKASSDSGAGTFLNSLMTGRKREEPRILKKGERVYVTNFNAAGNGLLMEIVTVETFPIVDQGRTRQVAYKAALHFQTADGKFPVNDSEEAKKIIAPFIVSEAEASATKTVELGQTEADVEAILGKPQRVARLGEKVTFFYTDMKVIFVNGKVTDVQ